MPECARDRVNHPVGQVDFFGLADSCGSGYRAAIS
jgi:hypothetical protein